jgi:uncharacterized protein (TIGR03437 family)
MGISRVAIPRTGFVLGVVLLAPALYAQAPTGLTVKAATSKRVDLTWSGTAASYTIQRAPLGGGYSTIATATNTSYSDTAIDAYTTYQYQVLNGTAASGSVTVGPPPSGVTNAAPAPVVGASPSLSYGYNLATTLDTNGDPVFLFVWRDPNATGDLTVNPLLFRSWNRAKYAWNPVVKITAVGDVVSGSHAVCTLAYDSSNGTVVAASEVQPSDGRMVVEVFVSTDGGATWTLKTTFSRSTDNVYGPSVSLANGNIYLAYVTDGYTESNGEGINYVTGQLSQSPTTWIVKQPGDNVGRANFGATPSLALDSAGNPAVAFWVYDSSGGNNGVLFYWKPAGSSAPVKITDTQNHGDGTAVKLVFSKLNPRVALWAILNDSQAGDRDGDGIHFSHSEDGGLTWAAPTLVPPDGNSTTDYPFDMAVDSTGNVAVGFGQNGNLGDTSHKCGNPKLSRSSNLTNFTTCSFGPLSVTQNFGVYPSGLQVAFGGNDKLYLLWMETSDTQANTGILMYREPPPSAITGPSITSVVNGATFGAGIVPGSWTTITGANLADVTRTWQDGDFNGNFLPTNLSGTSVKIGGQDASVYFVSPTQINVQAPANISGNVSVVVTHNGVSSSPATANVMTTVPGLFTYSLGGKTYPSALYNGTYTIVGDPALYGQAAKAKAGDIIQLYGTGLGPSPAGNIISSAAVFNGTVTATLGSTSVSVLGAALVAVGEFQINIQIPSLPDGEYPLVVKVNGIATQSGVIIPVTH